MEVRIYRLEPTEDTSNVPYAPPTIGVDDVNRIVTFTCQKRLIDMTSADKDEEIQWECEILVLELEARGFAPGLIDTILQFIDKGIDEIERRLETQGASGA
jgi:hypothetical protein